jgi:hypothetical protein
VIRTTPIMSLRERALRSEGAFPYSERLAKKQLEALRREEELGNCLGFLLIFGFIYWCIQIINRS